MTHEPPSVRRPPEHQPQWGQRADRRQQNRQARAAPDQAGADDIEGGPPRMASQTPSFDQAARTAEALARAAAAAGDTGVVSIQGPDQPVLSVFRPDMPPRPASTPFDPERDEAERAERLADARI